MRPRGKTDLGGAAPSNGAAYVWIILPPFCFFVNFLCKYDYVNSDYESVVTTILYIVSSDIPMLSKLLDQECQLQSRILFVINPCSDEKYYLGYRLRRRTGARRKIPTAPPPHRQAHKIPQIAEVSPGPSNRSIPSPISTQKAPAPVARDNGSAHCRLPSTDSQLPAATPARQHSTAQRPPPCPAIPMEMATAQRNSSPRLTAKDSKIPLPTDIASFPGSTPPSCCLFPRFCIKKPPCQNFRLGNPMQGGFSIDLFAEVL